MASARRSVQDFIAQVAAQTPGTKTGATYAATLLASGAVQVSKNGVIVYPTVYWAMGTGGAVSDTNISGDTVTLSNNDGTTGRGDAQQFINSLT